MDLDLLYTPAVELARRIRTRELSPVELMQQTLSRIEDVNRTLNCFCFVFADEALEKAHAAEQVLRSKPLSLFPAGAITHSPPHPMSVYIWTGPLIVNFNSLS